MKKLLFLLYLFFPCLLFAQTGSEFNDISLNVANVGTNYIYPTIACQTITVNSLCKYSGFPDKNIGVAGFTIPSAGIAPGATYTFVADNVEIYYYGATGATAQLMVSGLNGSLVWTGIPTPYTGTGSDDAPYTIPQNFSISFDGGVCFTGTNAPAPPCYTSVTWNPINSSVAAATYYGIDLTLGARSALVTIPAGGSGVVELAGIPCMDTNQTFLVQLTGLTPSDNDNIINGVPPAYGSAAGLGGATTPDTLVANVPSPNAAPAAAPVPAYNPTNIASTGSNSPIVYTQSASTNAILSQQQGNDALYTSIAQFAAQNHLDLERINNSINAQSNSFTSDDGLSNDLATAQTNFDNFTNSLQSDYWTNGSAAAAASYKAALNNLYGTIPPVAAPSGGDGELEIPVTSKVPNIKIDTTKVINLSTIRPLIIGLAASIIWTRLLVSLLGIANKSAFRVLQARQIKGSTQSAEFLGIGGNASIPTALVYSSVITAIVFAFPTLLVAVFTTVHTGADPLVNTVTNAINGVGPLWNVLTTFVPISVFLTAFTTWAVFKYLVCDLFVGGGMIIILFLFA